LGSDAYLVNTKEVSDEGASFPSFPSFPETLILLPDESNTYSSFIVQYNCSL
jgi:hypothetical protein